MRIVVRLLLTLAFAAHASGVAWSDGPTPDEVAFDSTLDLFWLCVLGYVALQVITARQLAGGWRIAALVPLIVSAPLLVYTLFGFAVGANLWPLLMLLLAPIGLVYLLGLLCVRGLARGSWW